MNNDIDLNDIADELLIVDKRTIEHLFELENCADCVALYMFFYKTAKWQGTRSIKANDTYIRKCLGWGARKVTATKKILESAGLIKKVARRKDGKIVGHFIEVAYLLSQNTRNPLVDETTCGFGETNAYRTNIKCSNNSIKNIESKDSKALAPVEEPVRTQRSLDIDQAFLIWEEVMGYPLAAAGKERFSINSILSRKGMDLDKLRLMVRLVAESQSDRYKRFSISSYTDMLHKTNDLMAWAREKQAQQQSNATTLEV
jgi:hypothetical protein